MKKIYTIIVVIAGLMLANSCTKFLDRSPLDDITPDKYFKSATELSAYTLNYYETFFTTWRGNYNAGPVWVDRNTDNHIVSDNSESSVLKYYAPSGAYYTVPAGQSTYNYFNHIRIANYFLSEVLPRYEAGKISGNEAEIRQYIGEGYLFRAMAYFNALSTYGDFPIILEPLTDDKEALVAASGRAPRNEVARQILSDLDQAASYLSESFADKVRPSKYVALLLKSRYALYEGTFEKYHKGTGRVPGDSNWPGAGMSYNSGKSFDIDGEIRFFLGEAMSAAKIVADANPIVANSGQMDPESGQINGGWNTYYDIFSAENLSGYSEVLMWRQYSRTNSILHGYAPYLYGGANDGVTKSFVDAFVMENGLPIYASGSGYEGDTTIDKQFAGRDERLRLFVYANSSVKDASESPVLTFDKPLFFALQNEHKDRTGFRVRKHMTFDPAQNKTGVDGTSGYCMYRSAEAYLNYIEADYELNGSVSGTSATYWNAIRTRAGITAPYTTTVAATDLSKEPDWGKYSGTAMVDATLYNIRRDRRCEFIGEGMRWNDLVRWRSFDQLKNNKYIVEGVNMWDELYKQYEGEVFYEGDNSGNTPNFSRPEDSKYFRPHRLVKANNDLYDGWTWHDAYYLAPIGVKDLTLAASDETVSGSMMYQNVYWPTEANGQALQ